MKAKSIDSKISESKIKVLAPVGSFESLAAAVKAGADAIYFGCGKLNMRSRAGSFSFADMAKIVTLAHKGKALAFLTLNTVMYDSDLADIHEFCKSAKAAKVDAVICSDIAAIQIAKSYGLRVHISTQQNISNIEAIKFFATFADTLVLARELTLEQIKEIHDQIVAQKICGPSGNLIELEAFVHGALCVAIAGKCGMSLATYNSSANRGACFQVCRRAYKVTDVETNSELIIDGQYVMSPKDLCTLGMLDKLISAGVVLLKIEGRARGPEYVSTVVSVYKEAVSLIQSGGYTVEAKQKLIDKVLTVFNRGFWQDGYYMGKKGGDWCSAGGSAATLVKTTIGVVTNFYPKKNVALIRLETMPLSQGVDLAFSGPTTGYLTLEKPKMYVETTVPSTISQGTLFTVVVPSRVRKNDKVYLITKRS